LYTTVVSTFAGSIEVNVDGGVPPYRYEWSNGITTPTQTDLGSGNYSVTVIDANNCSERATVLVNSMGGLQIALTATPTCVSTPTGTATANPNQGLAPFSYLWSDGQTTETATGLAQGLVTVTVTDARNCTEAASIKIEPADDCATDQTDDLVHLYPNPVQDELQVEIRDDLGNQVEVELLDMRGSRLQSRLLPTGTNRVLFSVKDIPDGMYIVRIRYFGSETHEGERLMRVIKW
ncbi:MAG: T9SS type A sorting domain-containing protein, partial [Bacteroidota bacterium]